METVVALISQETGVLLEIVNYNVDGQQYVCAGHVSRTESISPCRVSLTIDPQLRALWIMTQVLNELSGSRSVKDAEPTETLRIIQEHSSRSLAVLMPVTLERGAATIPLSGIDIPFHSTYLRGGIAPYRKFLEGKILEHNIDVDALVDKFIPNVIAKPFAVNRKYVEEAASITGSPILRKLAETVSWQHCILASSPAGLICSYCRWLKHEYSSFVT